MKARIWNWMDAVQLAQRKGEVQINPYSEQDRRLRQACERAYLKGLLYKERVSSSLIIYTPIPKKSSIFMGTDPEQTANRKALERTIHEALNAQNQKP